MKNVAFSAFMGPKIPSGNQSDWPSFMTTDHEALSTNFFGLKLKIELGFVRTLFVRISTLI